jgi:ADP-ribose pyrophosphatase
MRCSSRKQSAKGSFISARARYCGRLLNVYSQRMRFPNGYVGELDVVRHPGAALIVPFLDATHIVMIRQYRPVIGASLWELPAGTLHASEDVRACAARELAEETGYRASRLRAIGAIYPAPGYTTERIQLFEARGLRKVTVAKEADEVIRVRICSVRQLRAMRDKGLLNDAKTLAALARAGVL